MTPLVAVIAALATYRLTMLVVADELTAPWRDRIIDRYIHPTHELTHIPNGQDDERQGSASWMYSAKCRCGNVWVGDVWGDVMGEANGHVNEHRGEMTTGPRWLELLDCPWCLSMWIGFPVAWSAWCFGGRSWWMVPALALSSAAVAGIVQSFARPHSKPRR